MVLPDKSPSAEGLMVVYRCMTLSSAPRALIAPRVGRDWLWGRRRCTNPVAPSVQRVLGRRWSHAGPFTCAVGRSDQRVAVRWHRLDRLHVGDGSPQEIEVICLISGVHLESEGGGQVPERLLRHGAAGMCVSTWASLQPGLWVTGTRRGHILFLGGESCRHVQQTASGGRGRSGGLAVSSLAKCSERVMERRYCAYTNLCSLRNCDSEEPS